MKEHKKIIGTSNDYKKDVEKMGKEADKALSTALKK